ncbi:PIG-L family deacetylase [Synoicihabitans lomoniglobus]|uniref:PIG-L family deacetylase n=1 Tax=Synoicihabitans lomoniglobus TaxID=2909285 RepID=A0AAF0I433_9BACT|nr:PIG-L family deacetylase [Opitutaceae bacterium LMO-M01]WED66524.1 PIG-L family deacetylase [Opitutaceae bacterium LMO-M01]
MSTSPSNPAPLLAIGAHPDDLEFGVGGVLAAEVRKGRAVHMVIGSRGESGTNGTPEQRTLEAEAAAAKLGATIEFIDLGGDANIENTRAGARQIAAIIRRLRPEILLALSIVEDQHPDHVAVGRMTRDAARLARYGGLEQLKPLERHAITHLLYYAVSPDAVPREINPVLYALEDADVQIWREAMAAHASQMQTRDYGSLQITRASLLGQNIGGRHAIALYPNDPLVIADLGGLGHGGRHF